MNAFFETTNGFNFQIIEPLIESRGVRLTWFDCNMHFFFQRNNVENPLIENDKGAAARVPKDIRYLTIISRARVGYEMINS